MAGETTKTSGLTIRQGADGVKLRGTKAVRTAFIEADVASFATSALELNDVKLTKLILPTNAVLIDLELMHSDMDTHSTPTLSWDIGYYAADVMFTTTSGTRTKRAQNAVLDADVLVDGYAATGSTSNAFSKATYDAVTMAETDFDQEIWQVLGYDEDPQGEVIIGILNATAAATAAAGTAVLKVTYLAPM